MAKDSSERSRDRRKRLRQEGFKEVRNLWVRPENEPKIRAYAEKLEKDRKR